MQQQHEIANPSEETPGAAKRRERHGQILEAVKRIFPTGYGRTTSNKSLTVADICKEAKCSVGYPYQKGMFASRYDIIAQAVIRFPELPHRRQWLMFFATCQNGMEGGTRFSPGVMDDILKELRELDSK